MKDVLRRIILATAAFAAAVVAYAVVTAPPRRLAMPPPPSKLIVFGAYHVHTTRSDGALTPDQAAEAARRAGLSFLILTDHGDASRAPDPPRYVNGVLVIDAAEVSVVEGHVVALGLNRAAPYRLAGEARDVIEDIHRLGGFAIVAHPDSPRPDLRWRTGPVSGRQPAGDLAGADGIEWLNADSEWRDDRWPRLLQTLINLPVRPAESLTRLMSRPTATLRRWDTLTRRRPVVALGAVDAHGIAGRFYTETFESLAQVVELRAPYSGDAATDAAGVLDALRMGHAWSVVTGFASPVAARLTARTATGTASMGETLVIGGGETSVEIDASVDAAGARVSLWHNEQEIGLGLGAVHYQGRAEPGAYRAEAVLEGFSMPWIVTNPVYLATAPAPPAAPAVPPADEVLMRLAPGPEWAIEHGPASDGSIVNDRDAIRFHFRVGTVHPGGEYSALARSMGQGLESFDRMEFIGSASAPMRVLVQFRLPGGPDGERWSRSVYLDPTPRLVTVRMTDVVPVGFSATRRPVVARVKSILFVLDTLNTPPGTSGEVVLKDVRLARSQPASSPNGQEQVRRPGQK